MLFSPLSASNTRFLLVFFPDFPRFYPFYPFFSLEIPNRRGQRQCCFCVVSGHGRFIPEPIFHLLFFRFFRACSQTQLPGAPFYLSFPFFCVFFVERGFSREGDGWYNTRIIIILMGLTRRANDTTSLDISTLRGY
jgi:hypothetical protein